MTGLGGTRVGVASCAGRPTYDDLGAIRQTIRDALVEAGLGQRDPERPLCDIIGPGDTVLLKPNWVLHRNQGGGSMDCMITHPRFILGALAEVAAAGARKAVVADAPIQSADFDALVAREWREQAAEVGGATRVEIRDLRNVVLTDRGGALDVQRNRRPDERFVCFDVGANSVLEPISGDRVAFRVTNYDARHMAHVQSRGVHKYLLCREPFEADVILNLPKLKTHSKSGITGALKNLVGLNGDKNYLPHHRVGGSATGGDCYEGLKPMKRMAELCLDIANRDVGGRWYGTWGLAASILNRVHGGDLEGKWYGNDTTWRMVLDLNRIAIYGRGDGTLGDVPLRRVYSLTDAIVAGQGNGPLAPDDARLGVVTFAHNSAYADLVHCALMGWDWRRIPLVREAFTTRAMPLTSGAPTDVDIRYRGGTQTVSDIAMQVGGRFRAPDGWRGHVEASERPGSHE
jgi:uncharacterized protein (DUF362 family)